MSPRLGFVSAIAIAAACSFAAGARAQSSVWVVDQGSGPGSHFATIQEAIIAATDGDVILVRDGVYSNFHVDGKSLSILADTGSPSVRPLFNYATIGNLGSNQRVVLRGLRTNLSPGPFTASNSLTLYSSSGRVILENCEIHGGNPAIKADNTAALLLTSCDVVGGSAGIGAVNTYVHCYDSSARGGDGGNATFTPFGTIPAGNGGPGIHVDSGFAIVVGSQLEGGDGGIGIDDGSGNCAFFGSGGSGLLVTGGGTLTFLLDTVAIGGLGKSHVPPCANPGVAAPGVSAPIGTVFNSPETLRTLTIGSPVREGQSTNVTITGVPGEATLLLLSLQWNVQFGFNLSGTLLPALPFLVIPLVNVPPSGTLAFPAAIPASAIPLGIDAIELFVQVIVPGQLNQGVLGSSSTLAIIDSAF